MIAAFDSYCEKAKREKEFYSFDFLPIVVFVTKAFLFNQRNIPSFFIDKQKF